MEIEIEIRHKNEWEKYCTYTKKILTEEDLIEVAKKYIADNWDEKREVVTVEVSSIKP